MPVAGASDTNPQQNKKRPHSRSHDEAGGLGVFRFGSCKPETRFLNYRPQLCGSPGTAWTGVNMEETATVVLVAANATALLEVGVCRAIIGMNPEIDRITGEVL